MNDNDEMVKFAETQKEKAYMHKCLAEKMERLAKTKQGTPIIIDNFLCPDGSRRTGAPDNTFVGSYKRAVLEELELGGTSDMEPSGNDIGVNVEFETIPKILIFGGREYDMPSISKKEEFYKNATPRFVDSPEMFGTLHYNSGLFVADVESDRVFANFWLKEYYKTSLEEAGF